MSSSLLHPEHASLVAQPKHLSAPPTHTHSHTHSFSPPSCFPALISQLLPLLCFPSHISKGDGYDFSLTQRPTSSAELMTLLPVRLQAMQHISLPCPTLFFPSHPCFFLWPPCRIFFFQNRKGQDRRRDQSVGGRKKMSLLHRNRTCSCCFNKKPKVKPAKSIRSNLWRSENRTFAGNVSPSLTENIYCFF